MSKPRNFAHGQGGSDLPSLGTDDLFNLVLTQADDLLNNSDFSADSDHTLRRPFFSVVIPVYNRSSYLSISLDSVLEQTFQDFEILVVDDASTDSTLKQQLVSLHEHDERIRVFRMSNNSGPAACRNLALQNAIGEYVAFLDSDDIYMPWALSTFFTVIRKTNSPFIAANPVPLAKLCHQNHSFDGRVEVSVYEDYLCYRNTIASWWFAPSGVAIQTATLLKTGGFWEGRDIAEDADLWLRLGEARPFVRINTPHTYSYRLHQNNLHKDYIRTLHGILRLIRNEKSYRYPGGVLRKRERISIVAAHARHHSLELARAGCFSASLRLYAATLTWNLILRRFIFILMLPCVATYRKLCLTVVNRGSRPPLDI